jgi:hypothetical protein
MIQTPVSATDHQIAILQSLANSGTGEFAAGGKARAFGDSAGQEIGEAERAKVLCRDGSCAIRSGHAGAPDLGKISWRGAPSRKARIILPGGFQAGTRHSAKLARWELEEAAIPSLRCPLSRPLRGNKSALFEKQFATCDSSRPAGAAPGSPRQARLRPPGPPLSDLFWPC